MLLIMIDGDIKYNHVDSDSSVSVANNISMMVQELYVVASYSDTDIAAVFAVVLLMMMSISLCLRREHTDEIY